MVTYKVIWASQIVQRFTWACCLLLHGRSFTILPYRHRAIPRRLQWISWNFNAFQPTYNFYV